MIPSKLQEPTFNIKIRRKKKTARKRVKYVFFFFVFFLSKISESYSKLGRLNMPGQLTDKKIVNLLVRLILIPYF